jgi:hypothetical protein
MRASSLSEQLPLRLLDYATIDASLCVLVRSHIVRRDGLSRAPSFRVRYS